MSRPPLEQHFYASSQFGWAVDYDLLKCLKKLERHDRSTLKSYGAKYKRPDTVVFLVPGDINAEYQIDHYHPQVEGAKFLCKIDARQTRFPE
jgi:hypothetical protein